jgi:hypothetical protein
LQIAFACSTYPFASAMSCLALARALANAARSFATAASAPEIPALICASVGIAVEV